MRHFQMKVSLIEVRRRDFTQLPATAIILPKELPQNKITIYIDKL